MENVFVLIRVIFAWMSRRNCRRVTSPDRDIAGNWRLEPCRSVTPLGYQARRRKKEGKVSKTKYIDKNHGQLKN